ncbi:helix-turn-helix domain-containing protein [Candidatus Woesearchaeota archaeon]|nr:helix-turn-helix domain-containing protein [Candidatus Woesearchaeota archaeon]
MNEDILVDIGLSRSEAKIYLALLHDGVSTVTKVADTTKLHRANIYDALKKLVARGLATYMQKEKVSYYEAVEPSALMNILKAKENQLTAILPQLELSRRLVEDTSESYVAEGLQGLFNAMRGFLKYNDDIRVYGIPNTVPELVRTKIPHFHKDRIQQGVKMLHIYNHDATDRIKFLNKMKLTQARFLPESFDSQVSTWVCGDEIMITLWEKPLVCIVVKNKQVAQSYKKYFALLWEAAKK